LYIVIKHRLKLIDFVWQTVIILTCIFPIVLFIYLFILFIYLFL
jgi:hypothetical protein